MAHCGVDNNNLIINNNLVKEISGYTLEKKGEQPISLSLNTFTNIITNFKRKLIPDIIYNSSFIDNIQKFLTTTDETVKKTKKESLIKSINFVLNKTLNNYTNDKTIPFLLKQTIDSIVENRELNLNDIVIKDILHFLYNYDVYLKDVKESLEVIPEYNDETVEGTTDEADVDSEEKDEETNFEDTLGIGENTLTSLPVDQHEGKVNFMYKTPQELRLILSNIPKFRFNKKKGEKGEYEYEKDDSGLNLSLYFNWQTIYTSLIQISSNIYKTNDVPFSFKDVLKEIFNIIKDKNNPFYSDELKYLVGYDYINNKYEPLKIDNKPVNGLLTTILGYDVQVDTTNTKIADIVRISQSTYQTVTNKVSNLFISTFGRTILDWSNIVVLENHIGKVAKLYQSNVKNAYQTVNDIFKDGLQEQGYLIKESNNLKYDMDRIINLNTTLRKFDDNIERLNERIDDKTINKVDKDNLIKEKTDVNKKYYQTYVDLVKLLGDLEIKELLSTKSFDENFKIKQDIKKSVDEWLNKVLNSNDTNFIEELSFYKLPLFSNVRTLIATNKTDIPVLDFISKADSKKRYAAVNDNHIIRVFNELLGTNVKNWSPESEERYKTIIKAIIKDGPTNLKYSSLLKRINNLFNGQKPTDYLRNIQFIILDSISIDKLALEPDKHLPIDRLKSLLKAYTDDIYTGTSQEGSTGDTMKYALIPLHPNSVSKIIRSLRVFKYFMFDEHSDKWKKNFELKEGKIVLKDKNKILNTEVFSYITNESQPELALIANFINIIEDDALFNELNSKEQTKVRQGMQFVIFNYLNENDDVFEKVDVKDKGFKNYEKLGIKRKLKSEIIESFNDGKVHDIIKNASVANFIKLLDTNFETLLKDYSNDTDFNDYFSYGYKDILINKGFLPESNEVMPYVEKDNEIIDRFLSSNDSGTIQSHIDTLQKVHANLNKVNEYLLGNTKNNPYVDFKMYLINDLPLQVKGFNTTYTLGQEIAKNGVITQQNINDTLRALNILYNFQLKQFKSKLGDVVTTTPLLEIGLYNENTVTFYNKDENDKALLKLFLFEYTLNSRVTLNDAYHMLYGNGINMAVFDGDNLLLEETLYNFYKRNTAARSPNIPHSPLLRSKNTLINGYIDDLKGPSYELRKNIILNEPIDSAFANDYIHLLVPSIKDFTKFVETKYAGLSEDDKKKIYIKYNGLIKDQTVNKKVVFTSNFYINNGKLTAQIQDILEDYLKSHKDFKNAIKTLTVTSSYAFIKHTDAHDVMSFQFFIERALSYGYISNDLGLKILQDINNRKQEVKENIALKRQNNVELTIDDFAPLLYNVNTEYVDSLKDELYEIVKNSDMKVEFKNKTKSEIELETLMVLLMKDVFVGFSYNDNLRINELIFDKNSTRVLLPQHTYTNTTSFDDLPKLELLRLMMDINDIDRISPPSAIKTNVSSINLPSVGFWNVDYQSVNEVYDWFSGDNVPKLELNYNNYGDQTPQSDSDKSIWASQGKALILMNQTGKTYRTIVKNGNIIDNAIEITSENLSAEYQRKWKELYKSEYLKLLRKIEGENGSIDNDKLIKHIVQSLSHSANMSKNDKDSFMTVLNYMDMVLQKEPDHESSNSLLHYINEKLKINDDTNKTYKTLFDFFGKNEITTSDLNKFVIPLVFNPNSNKLQSVLNSLVTTKLTSKGFKAVLIPDIAHIGSKNIPTRENLIIASDEWNPSMPLKDKRIENGKVKPTQIVVSWNYRGYNQYMFDVNGNKVYLSKDEMDELTRPPKSFDLDAVEGLNERLAEIKHKYKNVKLFVKGDQIFINATSKNKEVLDIKQFLTDGKLDFKKFDKRLLLGIGNRIPAQIISSLTDFEIVGFITGIERATVIAPSDIIVRMGSDFDIDTLYSLLYNFKYSFFNSKKLNLIEYTDESDPNAEKIRYTKYLEQRLKNIGNVDDIKSLRNTVANAIHISPKNYKYSLLKVIYYKMIFASLSFIKTVAELKSPIEVNDENSIYKVMYKLLHNKFFIYDKVNKVYKLNDDIIKDNLPKNLLNVINKSKKDTWSSDEYLKMMDDIYTLVYPLYKEKPAGLHLANETIKIDEENVSFIDYVEDKLLKGESIRLKEFNNIYFKIKSVFNNYKEENEGKIFYDFIKVLDNNFQKSFAKFDKTNSYLYTSITEKEEKGDDESTEDEINQDNIDIRFELLKEMADKLIKQGVDTIDSFEIFRLKSVLAQNSFLAIENAIKDDFMTVLRHPDNVSLMMKPLKYGSFYNEHTSLTVKEKNKMVDDLKSIEFNSEKWFNKFSDYVDRYSLAIVIDAFSDRVLMRDPLNFLFNIKMYDSTRVDLTIIGAMALNQVGTVLLQTNEDRVKYYNIVYDITKSILGTNDMLIFGIKDKLLTMGLSDAGLVKNDGVINNQTLDKLTLGSNIISLGVDSSKIQVLSRLNATSINLNAYMGFMSKGMNEHWIALITNQDSIKDLNKRYDYYISERETRTIAYNSALGDIFMRYLNQLPVEFIENDEDLSKLIDNGDILQALVYVSDKITKEDNNYVYNIKALFETFYNKESDYTNYLYTQILSLYNFTVAYELGNALGDFFRKTNVDSQGIGSTYHGVILTLDKLEDVFRDHPILNIGNLYGDSMYLKYNYRLNTSYIETIEGEDYLVFERLHEVIQYLLDYDVHKTAFDNQELKGVKFKFNNLIISEKNEREEDIVNFIKSIIQSINSDDSKLSVYELLFIMKHEILKNKFNSRDDIVTEDYSVSRKKDVVSVINSFMMDISRENVFEHNIPYTMSIINEVIKKQTYTQVRERLMVERLKKIASYLLIPNDTLRLDNVIILPTHYKYFAIKYGSETAKNLYKDYFPYKSKLYSSLKHKLLEVNGFSPIYWTNNRYKLLDMHLSSYVAAKFYNVTKEQRQEYIEDTLSKYTALINNPNLNNSYKEFLNSFAKQEFNGLRYLIFLNSDSKNTNVDVYKVFESMFVDNDPDVSDFANSLLRYWLVVNGAYTSYRSIGSAIPNSIYLQQAISLYFRKIDWNDIETNTIFDKDDFGFLIQLIQHYPVDFVANNNVIRARDLSRKGIVSIDYNLSDNTTESMALILNDHAVTNIKVLTHRKNDLVPYDRLIFVNAKYLIASLLGKKTYQVNDDNAKRILMDKLSLLIDNEVNDDNKTKIKTLIGMINNTELSLDKLYLRIDNLGYNVYGHKVFEFSHYTNVPIGFSNNNSNIFPLHKLLSELLKVEENLNDFKYLYDAQFLDNDAVYDKDNVELINVDNILSPYFNESIKINKNTFNNLNEYVIYSLATYIKDESIINRLGQLVVKKQYNADDRLFIEELLYDRTTENVLIPRFDIEVDISKLNRNDIVNIITYFLRHKKDSAKLGIVDNAYIENIRKKRVYLLKDLLSKHIKGNDELQSELLKLSSKNIVIQTREQSANAYFGVRYNKKEDNYEGWNIYGKILDMIKQEMEIKESIKVNAESFTEFNNKGMVTINYAKKTLNSNDRVLLLSSINVEQSSDILNENDLIDPNAVYITLTDISKNLIQTYRLELTEEQQEIVNELVKLDKVTNEDRDNLRIQELSKIIESFFVESQVKQKNKPILTGFQGYMSGFDSKGKGTSQGDGKDKAMRQISDGFIGEIKPQRLNNSSSATSFKSYNIQRSDEVNTDKYNRQWHVSYNDKNNQAVIMLARNGEFKNIPLLNRTKELIKTAYNNGSEFVVGDMPGVDSQFIDYLQEIGAKFTIYHTGSSPRIQVKIIDNTKTNIQASDLHNKTQSENIVLPGEGDLENVKYTGKNFWTEIVPEARAYYENSEYPIIIAYRGNHKKTFLENYKSNTIGNPFNWQDESGTTKEKGQKSTQKFLDWILTGNNFNEKNATEEYRQALIKDFKSGKWKNSVILYYEEKGYPTHATVIDYLANKHYTIKETVESVIEISKSDYTKSTPDDKTRGFFFTENLQAYLAIRNRLNEYPSSGLMEKVNVRELKEDETYKLTDGRKAIFRGYQFADTNNYEKSKLEIAVFEINGKRFFRAVNAGSKYNIDVWNKPNIFITDSDRKLYRLSMNVSDTTIELKPRISTLNATPTLNVTATNNQAGIRTNDKGVKNDNVFAIISKKLQQDENGNWLKKEGQFKDNLEDFELFKKYNTEAIQEAKNSNLPLTILNKGIATGKSALPLRFAEWLNDHLQQELGISGTIKQNNQEEYDGYGIFDLKIQKQNIDKNIQQFEQHGTLYKFEVTPDDEVLSAEYKQNNKDWQPLNKRNWKSKYIELLALAMEEAEEARNINLGGNEYRDEPQPDDLNIINSRVTTNNWSYDDKTKTWGSMSGTVIGYDKIKDGYGNPALELKIKLDDEKRTEPYITIMHYGSYWERFTWKVDDKLKQGFDNYKNNLNKKVEPLVSTNNITSTVKEVPVIKEKRINVPEGSNRNNDVIFEDDDTIYLMNDGQQAAYNGIIKFITDKLENRRSANLGTKQSFTNPLSKPFNGIIPQSMWENMIGLIGKGGVGKTTIIRKIINDIILKAQDKNKYNVVSIKYAAPTHNAVTVLQESLGYDSEGSEGVSTLAALVARNQDRNSKNADPNDKSLSDLRLYNQKEYIKLVQMGFRDAISSYDIIIIDESSMVSTDFINDLIYRFEGEGNNTMPIFIYMGDFRQLSPIDKGVNANMEGIISATLFSDAFKNKHYVLDEVMRTKDKAMHNIFDNIGDQITLRRIEKNNSSALTPFDLKVYNENTAKSTPDILILKENAVSEVIKLYIDELTSNKNPDNIFWVHYNNLDYHKTITLYKQIRKEYFGRLGITDISENFMQHDYIQYNGTFPLLTNPKNDEKITAGSIKPTARLKVLEKGVATVKLSSTVLGFLTKYIRDIDVKVDWMKVYTRQDRIRYVEMIHTPLKDKGYNAATKQQVFSITDSNGNEIDIKLHYSEYKRIEETVKVSYKTIHDNFKPSYVGSSHTVQGKSVRKIIVGEYNLLSNTALDKEVFMRSLYTMLTRAVEKLIIIKRQDAVITNNQEVFSISKSNTFNENIEDIEFEEIDEADEVKINPNIIKNEDGLIIKENAISISDSIKLVEISKPIIETTSYKQTKGATSFDFKSRWTRLNSIDIKTEVGKKIARNIITGKQLNGKTITSEMIENWIKTGKTNSNYPLYVYTTLDRFGNPLIDIPQEIIDLLLEQGINVSEYEASYNSVYDKKDNGSLIIHQDNTEQTTNPIITISLGRPMKFITYELQDSNEFGLTDSALSAYRIAVNLISDKLSVKPKYGDITPSNILNYAKDTDAKNGNDDLQNYVKDVLTKTFKGSIKSEYILNNGTVLVFSGNNRNVLHEIVFDEETDKLPMPQGFPTLKVNKSFPGLGQSDRFVTTKDYRVVLTLRRITKSDTELNVLNVDKFLTTKVKETETQTELPQGQLSLFDKSMLLSLENYLLSVLDRKSKVILDKAIPTSIISNIVNNLSKRSIGYTVSHIGDKLTISKNPSALGKTNFNTLNFWKYIVDDLRYSTIDDEFKNGIKDNISKHFKVEEITKYGKDDFAFISTLTFGDKLYNLTENELQGMIREIYIEKTGAIPKITVVKSFKMYELRGDNKIENLKHVMVNSLDYTKHTGIELEGNIFEITSSKSLKSMYDDIKSINRKNSNNKTILSLGYDAEGGLFYTNKDKHSDLYNLINDFYNETRTAQLRDVTKVNNLVNAIKNGQLYIAHDGTFDKLMQVYFSNMLNKKTLVTKKDINNNYFLDIKPKTDFIDKPLEDEMVKNLRERLEKYVITEPNIDLHNDLGKLPENQWEILSKEFNNNKDVTELLNIYKCK